MTKKQVKRIAQIVKLKPEHRDEYIQKHQLIWPEVLQVIKDSNIQNYSLFVKDCYLLGYFEYVGNDFEADWAKMVNAPRMKDWWALMTPLMEPLPTRSEGEFWANMQQIFFLE